jgi:hypothetical protein
LEKKKVRKKMNCLTRNTKMTPMTFECECFL